MAVSFTTDIKPLFRPIDIQHMQNLGVSLDDYSYMSDASNNHENAQDVLNELSAKKMPPGGPFWTDDTLNLFRQWIADGYQP